jgi:hypothetical protein
MKKTVKTKRTPVRPAPAREQRRMKCACASCTCTVDMDRAVRRGNLVFCGHACAAAACTLEQCACEHDHCAG